MPVASVIIPFQSRNAYLEETLVHLARLPRGQAEIILLPDAPLPSDMALPPGTQVIPTGPVSPAIKRDQGAQAAKAEVLAFIDDDAYPAPDWLEKALPHFNDPSVAAVGGPQITPLSDGFSQQISGAMFLSPLNGKAVCRYHPCGGPFYVDDWPSVNLLVRRADFLAAGGFDSAWWPGEDTKLCLEIVKTLGKSIVYEPQARVFHHRRAGLARHLKQVGNYGLHRGHFAKRFPATSLRLAYFIPSLFCLFVLCGLLLPLLPAWVASAWRALWGLYGAALVVHVLGVIVRIRRPLVALATVPYLVGTHFWYGWRFMQGLATRDLRSRLGR